MKHLKCIGGIWDGRTVAIQPNHRYIVTREFKRNGFSISFDPKVMVPDPEPIQCIEQKYVIGVVHASLTETIEFLYPEEWDAGKTLRHALGPA